MKRTTAVIMVAAVMALILVAVAAPALAADTDFMYHGDHIHVTYW